MLVFEVTDGNSSLFIKHLDALESFIPPIEDQEEDVEYTIKVIDMNEEEFNNLDQFEGF